MKRYVIGITGASGGELGLRVLRPVLESGAECHLVVSSNAFEIFKEESNIDITGHDQDEVASKVLAYLKLDASKARLIAWANSNLGAPVASGSFGVDGTFVVPCSMKSLASIAMGYADNLISRAADVALKEKRPLVISPREMPFSAIHLENMLKLSRLGAVIAPPVPAMYHKPDTIEEMYDFLAGKILDSMGIDHVLFRRWGS
jgi:4-hydroxy-3-polyprenylbenzoate decarboxylase